MKSNVNLLTGSVFRSLLLFSAPLFLANLLQFLYGVVDMIVVGQAIGVNGVTAISNASTIVFVVNALCLGATTGSTVLIAHFKGADDLQGQRDAITATALLTLLAALLITFLGLIFCQQILEMMNVPSESFLSAQEYLSVIFAGTLFMFGYNAVHAILRGFGDSLRPFLFIGLATFTNVLLDILFIAVFQLGVVGAAYATIVAQGSTFAFSLFYLIKKKAYLMGGYQGIFWAQALAPILPAIIGGAYYLSGKGKVRQPGFSQ